MSQVNGYAQGSSEIRDQYLTLLITQLQNQNPMDPMSNDQMASQLAQLSQLEQIEEMNGKFDKVLLATQMNEASSLIGDRVTYRPEGAEEAAMGTVKGAEVKDGEVYLNVGGQEIKLEEILGVGSTGVQDMLASDLSQAASLIGKRINFMVQGADGNVVNTEADVRSVEFSDGKILLNAGDWVVEPHMVTGIIE